MHLQSTTLLMVRRWNDGTSTASICPYLASSSAFILTSSLIQSTDQHHGPLIHLRSVNACVVPYLVFLKLRVPGLVFDLIDGFPGRFINKSNDRRSFCSPKLGQNYPIFFKMLDLQSTTTTYRPSMERQGRRCLRGSPLLQNLLHFYFGRLLCKTQINH